MKIAITSRGDNLKSDVDLRFQAASYIIIYDMYKDDCQCKLVSKDRRRLVHELLQAGAEIILTGCIDSASFKQAREIGVKVYAVQQTSVEQTVKLFLQGKLEPILAPNALDISLLKKGLSRKY